MIRSADRWSRRAAAVLATLVAAIGVAGCGSDAEPTAAPGGAARGEQSQHAAMAESRPTWIEVPSIGAKSSLVPLGLNEDRTVEIPPVSKPMQAGWYKHGPTPGELGPAVILGHVDGSGQKGIFYRLREVKQGAEIRVGREDGSVAAFAVDRVEQVPKKEFPTDKVYGDTDDPEVRLITCGGEFDKAARSYRDNIIVYAKLVR